MKIRLLLCFLFMCSVVHASPQPGTRLWNIVADTDQKICTVQTQLDVLDQDVIDLSGTFTLLAAVLQKACAVESLTEVVDNVEIVAD